MTDERWSRLKGILARHDLSRRQPAASPWSGLLLGNGDMGAVMFGPAYALHARLNKLDLWDSRWEGNPDFKLYSLSEFKMAAREESKRLADGERIALFDLLPWDGSPVPYPCMRTGADFVVRVTPLYGVQTYEQRLHLADATYRAVWEIMHWERNRLEMTAFVSYQRNVLAVRAEMSEDGRRFVQFVLRRDPYGGRDSDMLGYGEWGVRGWRDPACGMLPAPQYRTDGATATLLQLIPGDENAAECRYCVSAVCAEGLNFTQGPEGHPAVEMREQESSTATFFAAIATEREGSDPEGRARELAARAAADGWDALLEEHRAAWRELWCRNLVELEARNQERKWYLGQYGLFCHAKAGRPAPGLFGVATPYDCGPWRGDRHNNYPEYAMLFWPAFPSNHLDIARNYTEHIHAFLPTARRIASEIFECDGAAFPHLYIDYTDRFYFDNLWSRSLYVTALTAQDCWLHYQYSQDEQFLLEMAYPVLREASDFYVSLVAKNPPGCYDLWPTVPCEYRGFLKDLALSRNCVFDLSCVKYLLDAAIRASEVLGVDEEARGRWRHLLENLPGYPTMRYKDKTIFADVAGNSEFPPYNHPVGISPMFPGQDPECFGSGQWRQVAEATLRCHEWASWPQICYARLGDREEAFRRSGGSRPLPEGADDSNVSFGHGFEAFNVAELLMSSWDGVIRVFPAWPLELSAQFEDLRAVGAFLVDAACAGGAVQYVRLRSEKGCDAALAAPWPEFVLLDASGAPLSFELEDGVVRFATKPGGEYSLRHA